jgi:hypothetical protein
MSKTVKQQLAHDVDEVARAVKDVKQAVNEIRSIHDKLSGPLSGAEIGLQTILSKDFVQRDEKSVRDLHRLIMAVRRIRELRNMMEIGSLLIVTDCTMDTVWKELP